METKKKGIIIFIIFILVVGVLYIKSLPPSTAEIDGKYLLSTKSTFDNSYNNISECQFKSGILTSTITMSKSTTEGNYKILDNDIVEIQSVNNETKLLKYKINRNDKNEVISMTYGDYIFERVNE